MRVFTALLVLAVLVPANPNIAKADEIRPIVFPVAGPNHYSDTFGAPRGGGRTHEGTDIMSAKMTPVVAAAPGTVGWVSSQCCAMELVHDDGYRSRYIHLNNDTPGTDDGNGWGFAPGIESGVHVQAGQLIGYVGDSGNAEATASHLHFELRHPNGVAFNSYPSLLQATPPDLSSAAWVAAALNGGQLSPIEPTIDLDVHATNAKVLVADFDGGGDVEVAVGDPVNGMTVSEIDGASSEWANEFPTSSEHAVSGDFDGDGDDDAAVMEPSGSWTGYRSDGGGFVTESWGEHSGSIWDPVMVGDFDEDGADEVLAFHPPSTTWWVSHLGSSGWVHRVFTRYGTRSGWLAHLTADVDGDGLDELVSYHPSNGTWWASGLGESPTLLTNLNTNSGWRHFQAVDLDADDVEELVQYHPSNGTWWLVDPSASPSRVALWAKFNTQTGWAHSKVVEGSDSLFIRHTYTGNVYSVSGPDGVLAFVGKLSRGPFEDLWLASHQGGTAFVGLARD